MSRHGSGKALASEEPQQQPLAVQGYCSSDEEAEQAYRYAEEEEDQASLQQPQQGGRQVSSYIVWQEAGATSLMLIEPYACCRARRLPTSCATFWRYP